MDVQTVFFHELVGSTHGSRLCLRTLPGDDIVDPGWIDADHGRMSVGCIALRCLYSHRMATQVFSPLFCTHCRYWLELL